MPANNGSLLLAVFWDTQIVRWGVWVGLIVLTVTLLILIRTRWGQSQPLGKCVVLSLLAHLLLAIYTMTVTIVTATVGSRDSKGIQVALIDSTLGPASANQQDLSEPWTALTGDGNVGGAGTEIALPPAAEPIVAAEPERQMPAEPFVPPVRSKPLELNVEEEVGPPSLAPADDSTAARRAVKDVTPIEIQTPVTTPGADVPPPEPQEPVKGGGEKTEPVRPASRESQTSPKGSESPTGSPPLVPIEGTNRNGGGDGTAGKLGPGKANPLPSIYKLREGKHTEVAKGFGATQESEKAVNESLRFLAANQSPDGRWEARKLSAGAAKASDGLDRELAGMQADAGISGLTLLAFLAAGHTHTRGSYQPTVKRGLEFLISGQGASGNLGVSNNIYERMYSHAMATCALSEAYAMTSDNWLQPAVRRAIGFTIASQDWRGSGGWRYHPGDPGDTSQLGWQVMALKSAQLGGIAIPDHTRDGIGRFLKSVSDGRSGGLARYQPSHKASRSMTAEALVCRQFMGIADSQAALDEASSYLLDQTPGVGVTNHYYWYYATLAMYQLQGEPWRRWNESLQKQLLASQRHDGAFAGSWDPDPVWGGCGGRAYSTALSTLCLEVYYRFLPLYVQAAGRDRRAN